MQPRASLYLQMGTNEQHLQSLRKDCEFRVGCVRGEYAMHSFYNLQKAMIMTSWSCASGYRHVKPNVEVFVIFFYSVAQSRFRTVFANPGVLRITFFSDRYMSFFFNMLYKSVLDVFMDMSYSKRSESTIPPTSENPSMFLTASFFVSSCFQYLLLKADCFCRYWVFVYFLSNSTSPCQLLYLRALSENPCVWRVVSHKEITLETKIIIYVSILDKTKWRLRDQVKFGTCLEKEYEHRKIQKYMAQGMGRNYVEE